MRLHRLHLRNFRQHEDTDLAFGLGVTGIIGPNGVGKSTLLEALAWALYGTSAARGTRDSIRRRGAPARSRVEVVAEFGVGAHEYRVTRSLHGAELYQDGAREPIANSLGAVSERVTRLLGMSREEFFNTYFTGQKELAILSATPPADRARFLSRVMGYERLRRAQDFLREERAGLRARLEVISSTIPDAAQLDAEERNGVERLAQAESRLAAAVAALAQAEEAQTLARPRWEEMQALQEQVRALESDLRVAEHQVSDARTKCSTLDLELAEAITARARYEELRPRLEALPPLRTELQEHEHRATAFHARNAQRAELEMLRAQLGKLEGRLAALPAMTALPEARETLAVRRSEAAAATERAARLRSDWISDKSEAVTRRQQLLDHYNDIRDQRQRLQEAGPDGACPTCNRPLGREYADVLEVLDRQIGEVTTNGRYFAQRVEQLSREPAELVTAETERARLETEVARLQTDLGRLERTAQDREATGREREGVAARIAALMAEPGEEEIVYDAESHAVVKGRIAELEPVVLQAERLQAASERAERLTTAMTEAEARLSTHEAEEKKLRQRLESLGWSPEVYAAARDNAVAATRDHREAELAETRAEGERQAAAAVVAQVQERRVEREVRLRERERVAVDLLLNQELDRTLTDLRADLNATLRPDLSDIASTFLRDLTGGRYTDLELSEDYVATIIDDGVPLEVISGGEEDLASLALRLAISQMIAERAGQPLSLLVLDEVFGSLDEDRRGAVLELLRSLADRFPQVILITHIEGVREGVDRVIRIAHDVSRGVSTARDEPIGGVDHAAA